MSDPDQLRTQALALLMKGDTAGGISDLRQVVELDPDDAESWLHLGTAYAAIGHMGDAAAALKQAVELDSDVCDARVAYARVLVQMGKLDDAAFQLLKASQLEPSDARIQQELGIVFYEKRLYDKALVWLSKAAQNASSDARVHYALGLAYEAKKDIAQAIACYREALRRDARLIDARRTLSDALASIGEHESAIAELNQILQIERSDERAAHNRDVLRRALAEMKAQRLLGKSERELEQSALYGEGQFRQREGGQINGKDVRRYIAPMTELYVTLSSERTIESMMLVFSKPDEAARAADDTFYVKVIGEDGSKKAANYATGASLTFIREAIGCPMTQASELYRQLLSGEQKAEWGGAVLRFSSMPRPDKPSELKNGILVSMLPAQ